MDDRYKMKMVQKNKTSSNSREIVLESFFHLYCASTNIHESLNEPDNNLKTAQSEQTNLKSNMVPVHKADASGQR